MPLNRLRRLAGEQEVAAARSSAGNLLEDRREEVFVPPHQTPAPPPIQLSGPPPPAPAPAMAYNTPAITHTPAPAQQTPAHAPAPIHTMPPPPMAPVAPGPVVYEAGPPRNYGQQEYSPRDYSPRDYSPSRTTSTSSSWDTHHQHYHEASGPVPVGPMALAERPRSRSRSRSRRDIRAEIKALERELVHRPKTEVGPVGDRELVRAERLPDGQLVIYEEQVERVEHSPKPARIEKDKKGRLAISVPRR